MRGLIRSRPAAVAALALGALVGCARAWDFGNRAGLLSDVTALLAAHGVTPRNLDCRMEGTTRDASCSFRAPAAEVEALARALALEQVDLAADSRSPLFRLVALAPGRCGARGVPASGAAGRPASLRLKSGRAFEFLVLFHADGAEEACLFLSYAYG
ncbi:MAG: hypothetical protein IPL89_08430 [Acidobacteria bacterium]|nr:hypothetical protein [Acidobacteriota bacterium]